MGGGGSTAGATLGLAAGIVAAPFTGGASLAVAGMIGAGIGGSIGASYDANRAQKKSARAQNRANAMAARQAEQQNQRALLQQVRANRIARGRQMNVSAQTAGVESSGAIGAVSSVDSQTAGNVNFMQNQWNLMNQQQSYLNRASRYTAQANQHQQYGQMYGQLASLGFGVAGYQAQKEYQNAMLGAQQNLYSIQEANYAAMHQPSTAGRGSYQGMYLNY